MAVTVAAMVVNVRRLLGDNPALFVATSDPGTASAGATDTFTVADSAIFEVGEVLEWQDDGELNLITGASGGTLTVIRGYLSSVASPAAHAVGILFAKDPEFQYVQITEAISSVIAGLWPYLYKKDITSLTPGDGVTTSRNWYDLPQTTLDLSSVVQVVGTSPNHRLFYYGARGETYPVRLRRDTPDDFPDSTGDTNHNLYIPYLAHATNTIKVVGIAKITDTVATAEYSDVDAGLMEMCITEYVVSRLVGASDITRSTQKDIMMGDQSIGPRVRTTLAAYWANEAKAKRFQMEQELKRTLPRMPIKGGPMGTASWRR